MIPCANVLMSQRMVKDYKIALKGFKKRSQTTRTKT